MKIHVSNDHILKGRKADPKNDPVALALKDAGFGEVYVGATEISVRKVPFTGNWTKIPAPHSVSDFMHAFDNDYGVEPFEFELAL